MNVNDVFNSENRFFSLMNKIWDLMVLNWLFILTVVIGIGPAATGLYYAVAKNIRKSRGYAMKTFFHSFKVNFKQAFTLGILQLVCALSVVYCYWFAMQMKEGETVSQVYFTLWLIFTVLFVFISIYVYPILSRFNLSTMKIIKMAFVVSLRHLPSTLVMTLLVAIEAFLVWMSPAFLSILLLGGISGYVLLKSLLMEKILRRYTPKPAEGEESSVDAWYLE
ncbi:MAG: DUF624 domain-containing protein [Lachnospiraceae bacterium]|nr:DUF624 domain-containing protein [Lachnospiraceae bacterium]